MAKQKKPMLRLLLIFLVIEVMLVLISGSFHRQLEIGFQNGSFIVRNIESKHDLQEKITEEFQIDEYYKKQEDPSKSYSNPVFDKFKKIFERISLNTTPIGTFQLLRMILIVDLLILLIIFLIRSVLRKRPSKSQIMMELTYTSLEGFVIDTLGKKRANYTPYIVTLFLFLWICNMIGMIPIPGFIEPTRNLNVPLGLGLMAVVIVHYSAIKYKGTWNHLQEYMPHKNPLFILDIIGEVSKIVSISFRLFGNILGGAIIILVVSSLVNYVLFPVGLNLFFGIFVGTIQAFVFTMLALSYIGAEIAE
jgi:F-type H+-transporting ATPase subunit a